MGGSALSFAGCLALLGAVSVIGCNGAGGTGDGDRGSATIALTQVPPDVTCIRITVAGSRTVQKSFNVIAGQSSVLALTGLPTGDDTFTGEAFSVACAAVGPATVPAWIGDPVIVTVGAATPVPVNLVLRRNGQATVSVDFDNGPDGGAGSGRANGAACATAADCRSAFCVDGVCCDSACTGACQSCANPGRAGVCSPAPAGTLDPIFCQSTGPATCATDGTCDGAGACRLFPAGTLCASPSCTGSLSTAARVCNGAGTCQPGATVSCAPFLCQTGGAPACATRCATRADCVPATFCDGAGLCQPQRQSGQPCASSDQCLSNSCQSGVCA